MIKEEIAIKLNGRQIGTEITREEINQAKQDGLVVVYGAGDDLMELCGAINDEVDCFDGGIAQLNEDGVLNYPIDEESCGECKYFSDSTKNIRTIKAVWDKDGCSWVYETDIPHVTFEIFDGKEKYCRGIIFDIKELRSVEREINEIEKKVVGELKKTIDEQIEQIDGCILELNQAETVSKIIKNYMLRYKLNK